MTISSPLRKLWGELAPIQPLAAWGTAEAPPKEFLIFKFGENHATLGGRREVVTLSPKNAQRIVNEWRRRRISGAFDYEHAVTQTNPQGTPAAGWFGLAVRADGLWAVGITWTDRALKYFKGKEYRYFSPYFAVNSKGEVTSLYNIALTNWPATDQQRPLIALTAWATRRYTMEPLSLEQLKAKAQELIDTFSAKGDLMDLAMWLDKLQRGEGAPVAIDAGAPEEMLSEATPEETAIAQAAYTTFGVKTSKEAIASLKQFSVILKQRDDAQAELRQIKHSQAVDAALKAGKITPAQKDEALKDDPDEFRIAMKYANPARDNTTLTPKTAIAKVEGTKLEELEKDPKLVAYCKRMEQDPKEYAQLWASKFPGEPFAE